MKKISCLIVEDEPPATRILKRYIEQLSFLQLEGSFKDALYASAYLQEHTTDLIFLDIHLPGLKGTNFLKTLSDPPEVIFTTAYHQYALEGFELEASDYLLKPFDFERFLTAVNRARKRINWKQAAQQQLFPEQHGSLLLTVNRKQVKIRFRDILYIESQREYVNVHTTDKDYLSKTGTHEIERLLPADQFRRVHRSFIVSLTKIEACNSRELEIGGRSIPLGKQYRNNLGDWGNA